MIIFNGYLKKEPQRLVIPQTLLREVLRPQEAAPVGAPAADGAVAAAAAAVGKVGQVLQPATGIAEPKPADVVAEMVERGR